VPDSRCNDCLLRPGLPFPCNLYGTQYMSVTISSNGNLQFSDNPGASSDARHTCSPSNTLNFSIFALWANLDMTADQCPNCGVFTSVIGVSPNRVFNIEWRAIESGDTSSTPNINFELRLYEQQDRFDIVYAALAGGGNGS